MIRIRLTSVMVDDQAKARDFYTRMLGFRVKHDVPLGEASWLTVTTADEPDGTELLLEPISIAEAAAFQKALFDDDIPIAAFAADDLYAEHERLKDLGVALRGGPSWPERGPPTLLLEDGCGNLIQLFQA